jgi:hypothetical protein
MESELSNISEDMLSLILKDLPRDDMVAMTLVSKKLRSLSYPVLRAACHACHKEIEHNWNYLARHAELAAYSAKGDQYGIKQASESDIIKCSVFPGDRHSLKNTYVINPRDINMMFWYLNRDRKGCTIW